MPQRFIYYTFDFIISAFTLTIFISSMSVLTLIVGILSGLFWLSRIKGLIEKHHNGDAWSWFCWLIKKKISNSYILRFYRKLKMRWNEVK